MNLQPLLRYALKTASILALPLCFATPPLAVTETDDALLITQGERTILKYNKSIQHAPEGMDPLYSRSGYIHPVFTPTGQMATGDFSVEHAHQRGIFNAATNTEFRGEKVDFWNLHQKRGRTEHAKTLSVGSSNDSASFTVAINHVSTSGETETIVLNEWWQVTARQSSEDFFLFDIESNQTLATDDPLLINEYHYGGMALRGSNSWAMIDGVAKTDCAFLTSEGDGRADGNHTHPRWVSVYGEVDGSIANITALCHPDNFRFPQAVRIHPKLPYFSFSPMFDGEFSIQKGERYTARYRYLVTSSEPDTDWIEAQWKRYAQ